MYSTIEELWLRPGGGRCFFVVVLSTVYILLCTFWSEERHLVQRTLIFKTTVSADFLFKHDDAPVHKAKSRETNLCSQFPKSGEELPKGVEAVSSTFTLTYLDGAPFINFK